MCWDQVNLEQYKMLQEKERKPKTKDKEENWAHIDKQPPMHTEIIITFYLLLDMLPIVCGMLNWKISLIIDA